jgi:ABC-type proline/glycine betaine transport system permease subunit
MAEVKTAPAPKTSRKSAAKAAKARPRVQAKPELQKSADRAVQPLYQHSLLSHAGETRTPLNIQAQGLWKNSVQTKLKTGKPGDKYEQEADAVADNVISSSPPQVSLQAEEEKIDQKPLLQTKPEEELQPKAEEEPDIQQLPEEEDKVQAMPEEENEVQAKDGDASVPNGFESKLDASKSGGSPLPESTIAQVEPHVNADLSGVRVHTDSNAVQLNQSLGSQAFANQNHIFFNEGKFNPGTTSGDHLIAHEVTHTVQQGAAVKKKPGEEEQPDEVQMKTDTSADKKKQAPDPPADNTPPADNSAANNSPAPDNASPNTPATGNNGGANAGAGNNTPPSLSDNGKPAEPGQPEDLQKENPITRRASDYKEEKVAQVKALGLEGNSEQAMESFTGAGASQVAMAFPGMGDALNQKLGSEKQAEAQKAPKLTAGTTGVKDQKTKQASDPGSGKSATLNDGITEGEPAAPKVEPYQEGAPLPQYKVDDKVDQGKPAKEESGGFFSWLFDKFKDLMGGITTVDKGLHTKAGTAPKIDAKGKANPERAALQSKEGKDQVNKEKQETANEINKNPGQQNIQPLYFEEPKEVAIDTQLQATATTQEDQAMSDFVNLPLPESVRTQTDLDLAPKMEKSLSKPRQDTKAAAQKRDTEKQSAINEKQAEVEKMNKDAEKQQQNLVAENRKAIASEQQKGVQEAETQMNAFSTEADKEKANANKAVNARIKKDQAEGEKKLKTAEAEAEQKKKQGEKDAKAEKAAAKKNSKKKSWWGKFKDAVSSAVSWVTDKISKIFDAVRKAVKFIIDKAKAAALALIEAGRKWIIDKLDKFGSWLKEKANKYLKHFPALRKRVNAFIDKTVEGAKKLVNKVADGLKKGVEALANALGKAINSILNAFETALTAAVQVAGALLKGDFAEALKIAFFATCKIAGIDPTPIMNFINKAGETINLIFKDPAAFFGNVAGGVKLGINQFVKNIKKHLISGLISWLTGAMSDVPIQMPAKFDLKGIFSLVMQILGLTYDRIRAKVVKRIGPKGEQIVSGMEKTFQFVKDLITKGPIALWERIKDKFNEIKEMAMEKIRNLVTIEVVKAGIKWLIGLLNPASAIVKAVLMLYDFVMFLIERKDQIVGFVMAVFDTVGPLARGQLKKAGNAVEGAMGRGVPVILGLLANLAGLGGIGKSVSKVIKTIQKPVDKVVDPVIGWLVKQGKRLWKKGKAGAKKLKDKALGWWNKKKPFKAGNEVHHVVFKGDEIRIHSVETKVATIIADHRTLVNDMTARGLPLPSGKSTTHITSLYGEASNAEKALKKAKKKASKDMKKQPGVEGLTSDQDRDFNTLITAVRTLMTDLQSKSDHPDTKIEYLSKENNLGKHTVGKILTIKKGSHTGTAPSASANNPIWSKVSKRKNYYERAHFVSDRFHGSGSRNENLTPIERNANNNVYESLIESPVKDKIWKENKVVKMDVTASYGAVKPKLEAQLTKINAGNHPYTDEQKVVAIDVINNEKKLADSITAKAWVLKQSGNEWVPDGGPFVNKPVPNKWPDDLPQIGDAQVEKTVRLSTADYRTLNDNGVTVGLGILIAKVRVVTGSEYSDYDDCLTKILKYLRDTPKEELGSALKRVTKPIDQWVTERMEAQVKPFMQGDNKKFDP